jgi:hypothetical protein
MELLFWFIELAATAVEAFIFVMFASEVMKNHLSNKHNLYWLVPVYVILTTVLNSFSTVSKFNLVACGAILSVFLITVTKRKYIHCIMLSMTYLMFVAVIEMFLICFISVLANDAEYVFKILESSNYVRMLYVIISKLIDFAVFASVKKSLKNFNINILKNPVYVMCVCIGFVMIFKTSTLINNNDINSLKVGIDIMFVVFLIIFAFVIYLSQRLIEEIKTAENRKFIGLHNEELEINYKKLNCLYAQNSKNFHEFNHHISIMKSYVKNKDYESLNGYLSNLDMNTEHGKIFHTGNSVIDVVLNINNQEMEDNNISFDTNLQISENINIPKPDLCSLLANILENAIEAEKKTEAQRNIKLSIETKGNMLFISATNSAASNPELNNFNSVKKGNHGWGMKIIKEIAEKYNGEVLTEFENGRFTVKVMILQEVEKIG